MAGRAAFWVVLLIAVAGCTGAPEAAPMVDPPNARPLQFHGDHFQWNHAGNEDPLAIRIAYDFPAATSCEVEIEDWHVSEGTSAYLVGVLHAAGERSLLTFSVGGSALPYAYVGNTPPPGIYSALQDGFQGGGAQRFNTTFHGEVAMDFAILNSVAGSFEALHVDLRCTDAFSVVGAWRGTDVTLFSVDRLEGGTRVAYPAAPVDVAFRVVRDAWAAQAVESGTLAMFDISPPDVRGSLEATLSADGVQQSVAWGSEGDRSLVLDVAGPVRVDVHERTSAGSAWDLFFGAIYSVPEPFDLGLST